jgi:hypothetical protein
MTRREKLVVRILAQRDNPCHVRFEDACKVARMLGFDKEGGKGSHRSFSRTGEPTGLNFQSRNGLIPTYQARQLIDMIEKYGPYENDC